MTRRYTPTIQFDKRSNRPLNESQRHDDFGTAVYDSGYAVEAVGKEFENLVEASETLVHFSKMMRNDQEELMNYSKEMGRALERINSNPDDAERVKDSAYTAIESAKEHEGYSQNIENVLDGVEGYQDDLTKVIRDMRDSLKELKEVNRDVKKYGKRLV